MNENPYSEFGMERSAPPQSLPFFKAWLLFYLLAAVVGAGVGFVAGMITAIALNVAEVAEADILIACQVLGFVVSLPVSYVCYKWSVQKYLLK